MFIINTFSTCCRVRAPCNAAPHNRYQPQPAEPAQHTTCSNTRLGLLKMSIMMSETCWESVDNKHLTVASCWFSLSLHYLLTMHGHRNLKLITLITRCVCCTSRGTDFVSEWMDTEATQHSTWGYYLFGLVPSPHIKSKGSGTGSMSALRR